MLFNPGWKFKISQLYYKGILMYQNEPVPNMPWNGSSFSWEWIRKLWYIYTMEYYSDVKNNSFESVLMRWMKLEPIRNKKFQTQTW